MAEASVNQAAIDIVATGNVRRFAHQAMATLFEVLIAEEDPAFGAQAARAVFDEIDRLEGELSRFRPNSDISRINALAPGTGTVVGLDAFACLAMSKQCAGEMWGAFDVTVGPLMECLVAGDGSPREPRPEQLAHARGRCGMHLYELDPVTHSVRIGDRVPLIDLGAIGKGYAVDRAVEMLKEWGVGSALVHSGTSSVFAYGALGDSAGWPVALRVPDYPWDVLERIVLAERAVSGSGTVRRRHIIDPRSGGPVLRRAAWASVASAAYSDALSTACMVMDVEEISRYSQDHPHAWIVVLAQAEGEGHAQVFRFGGVSGGLFAGS